jgi:hypothetical protein
MGTERRVERSYLLVRAATIAIQWTAPWPTQGDLVEHRVIDPTTMTRLRAAECGLDAKNIITI